MSVVSVGVCWKAPVASPSCCTNSGNRTLGVRPIAELGPFLHQPAPLLKEIATPISRLDLVADGMGQGHFRDLAWVIRAFRRPVPKGRPEAMCRQIVSLH